MKRASFVNIGWHQNVYKNWFKKSTGEFYGEIKKSGDHLEKWSSWWVDWNIGIIESN